MKPVCVKCQRFFRAKKNGFYFVESMPAVAGALPGTAEPEKWQPYKLWSSDYWECDGCGAAILSGFGKEPITEHFEDRFEEKLRAFGGDELLRVNDC